MLTLFPINMTLQPFLTPSADNGCSNSFRDFPKRKTKEKNNSSSTVSGLRMSF